MHQTPVSIAMSLMIRGSLPMVRFKTRAEGIARGLQILMRLTQQDFGYDLWAWHQYLNEHNLSAYQSSGQGPQLAPAIGNALKNPQWQKAVAFAQSARLLERLNEQDQRQHALLEKADDEWAGQSRTCPRCQTSFQSARNRGQCPQCHHVFLASHPEKSRSV